MSNVDVEKTAPEYGTAKGKLEAINTAIEDTTLANSHTGQNKVVDAELSLIKQ
jgi:hypothetical protein